MTDNFAPAGLAWLFLDLNSYFASVEQQENPALRGKPIAVVPMDTDATCAIAASYEAKAFGVKTGTKIYEAKKMCPGLICVPARHDKYVQYHHRVLAEAVRHVPINKVWSIDELSSRLPPRLREPAAAIDVAQRLKAGIRDNVGAHIHCSVGIAPNSFLAKVATDMQKPNGLVLLEPATMRDRILALKLRDLPGINVKMEERLRRGGVTSVEALWNLHPKQARAIWGGVGGERFLHGYDVPDTPTSTSSIGHSRVLDLELRTPDAARQVARRLVVKSAARLRRKGLYATSFGMSVRNLRDEKWSREVRLPAAHDNYTFLNALDAGWDLMLSDFRPGWIKKVNVTLQGLSAREATTGDLFAGQGTRQDKRAETLSTLMDRINEKYGGEAISLGVSPKMGAGFVGTKIAFSRIPDLEEFHE